MFARRHHRCYREAAGPTLQPRKQFGFPRGDYFSDPGFRYEALRLSLLFSWLRLYRGTVSVGLKICDALRSEYDTVKRWSSSQTRNLV